MYTQRISMFPANGKGPELRPILEERVRTRQSQGVRAALSMAAFGAEGPVFTVALLFDDLGALEALRANPLPVDPRLATLTRQPNRLELYEVLLPAQASNTPVRYIQRITRTPLAGKGRDVRALVPELAKARQTDGIRTTVAVQVAGPAATSVVTNTLFGNLAELEKLRARNQTDTALQQFQEKISTVAGPQQTEIFESLIPFQPM